MLRIRVAALALATAVGAIVVQAACVPPAGAEPVDPAALRPAGALVELAGLRPFHGGAVQVVLVGEGAGAYVVFESGEVAALGAASVRAVRPVLEAGERVIGMVPAARGYLLVTDAGRAIVAGDATWMGDLADVELRAPIVDVEPTASGAGYWMLGADGGVFAFGDARFSGSTGALTLNQPADALVRDPDGTGYWFVAADGGVFAFDAPFLGSMGATPLNAPVVGMVPYGDGYAMVAADGGAFVFADRPFLGSLGASTAWTAGDPVVGIDALGDGSADVLVHRSGRITSFGAHPAWVTEGDDAQVGETGVFAGTFTFSGFDSSIWTVEMDGAAGTSPFFPIPVVERRLRRTDCDRCIPDEDVTVWRTTRELGDINDSASGFLVLDGTDGRTGEPLPTFVIRFSGTIGALRAGREADLIVTYEYLGQTDAPLALIAGAQLLPLWEGFGDGAR